MNKTVFTGIRVLVIISVLALASHQVHAQSPMINYQGKVTDSDGVPLAGSYSIQFSIYGQEAGGTALWTETQSLVTIQNGIFTVLLGSVTSFSATVFNGDARWLGVKVGTDPELSPRQPIVSVGYALRADKANEAEDSDRLDNHDASYFATAGHSHDIDYINDNAGEINASNDFNFSSPTLINNLNADLLDGLDASSFMDTTNDYGRSGVAANLYEGTTKLSNKYLKEVGPDTITGSSESTHSLSVFSTGSNTGAILGIATGSSGNSIGVYGQCTSGNGAGVYGFTEAANGSAVVGYTNGSNATGVTGTNSYSGGGGIGVKAHSSGTGGYGVYATGGYAVYGDSHNGPYGVYGSTTNGSAGVYGTSTNSTGVYGTTERGDSNYGVYCSGNFAASGTKSCIVKTSKGPAKLYCQESPENWFEDF